jgi:hypothetical protein
MKRIRDRQLRTSRCLLVVIGLALLTAAVIGALLAGKVIHGIGRPLNSRTALLNVSGMRLLRRHQLTFQLVAVLVALALIGLGITWLRRQIPPVRHHEDTPLDITDARVDGRNMIAGDALARALETDLEQSPYITRARAEVQTASEIVRLRLDVDEEMPVGRIIATVVEPAIARVATVAELVGRPRVETDIRLVRVLV